MNNPQRKVRAHIVFEFETSNPNPEEEGDEIVRDLIDFYGKTVGSIWLDDVTEPPTEKPNA